MPTNKVFWFVYMAVAMFLEGFFLAKFYNSGCENWFYPFITVYMFATVIVVLLGARLEIKKKERKKRMEESQRILEERWRASAEKLRQEILLVAQLAVKEMAEKTGTRLPNEQ